MSGLAEVGTAVEGIRVAAVELIQALRARRADGSLAGDLADQLEASVRNGILTNASTAQNGLVSATGDALAAEVRATAAEYESVLAAATTLDPGAASLDAASAALEKLSAKLDGLKVAALDMAGLRQVMTQLESDIREKETVAERVSKVVSTAVNLARLAVKAL